MRGGALIRPPRILQLLLATTRGTNDPPRVRNPAERLLRCAPTESRDASLKQVWPTPLLASHHVPLAQERPEIPVMRRAPIGCLVCSRIAARSAPPVCTSHPTRGICDSNRLFDDPFTGHVPVQRRWKRVRWSRTYSPGGRGSGGTPMGIVITAVVMTGIVLSMPVITAKRALLGGL